MRRALLGKIGYKEKMMLIASLLAVSLRRATTPGRWGVIKAGKGRRLWSGTAAYRFLNDLSAVVGVFHRFRKQSM
jgi:hypothetical protein